MKKVYLAKGNKVRELKNTNLADLIYKYGLLHSTSSGIRLYIGQHKVHCILISF